MPGQVDDTFTAALTILVPEADPYIGDYRRRYDPSAERGVPAHITINIPFLDFVKAGDAVYPELHGLFIKIAPFNFSLVDVRCFPGVLYLAPEPQGPFIEMIDEVYKQFPGSPPYGGIYDEHVPHLTVVHAHESEQVETLFPEIEVDLRVILPIQTLADRVWLLENSTGIWQKRIGFPLGETGKGFMRTSEFS